MEQIVSNQKYFVAPLNSSKAIKFVQTYHYSHQAFNRASLNLGVYDKSSNLLKGVMQWGISAAMNIKLDRYVKEPITNKEYFELNRFCMEEEEERNSESQAISLGIKWIKKFRPDIKLLVSYSGRREGKYGYIYQATNWEYLGYFVSNGFWELDGEERHLISVQVAAARKGKNYKEYAIETYSRVVQTWTKQFIYIQRLDKKLTPASEVLPYPKPTTEYPIKVREKVYKDEPFVNQNRCEDKEQITFYYDKDEQLFSNRALLRQGGKPVAQQGIGIFDSHGKFLRQTKKKLLTDEELTALRDKTLYNGCYYKLYQNNNKIPDSIPVKACLLYEGKIYTNMSEVARMFGTTRQNVSLIKKKGGTNIKGHEIQWINRD